MANIRFQTEIESLNGIKYKVQIYDSLYTGSPSDFSFALELDDAALSLTVLKMGTETPANIAMIVTTIRSSIRVKALFNFLLSEVCIWGIIYLFNSLTQRIQGCL